MITTIALACNVMMVRLELHPNWQVMLRKLIFFAMTAIMLSSFQCLYAHNGSIPLPSDKINEYPFNIVGKVASGEFDAGSGTAISQKVVLGAAHSFFREDKDLPDWHLRPFKWNLRHSPSNQSFDISARSYMHFSDYAEASRRFTTFGKVFGGAHSLEQFNRDVITLIFLEDVADGGHARWSSNRITDNSDKMIVGYPVLINYGGTYDPRRQTMHATSLEGSPAEYTLINYKDRLGSISRVYETYDLSAGRGNSGGPVYGLITFTDETVDWGVVGIHVAGTEGRDSYAVGIDQAVSDIIKAAESTSDSTSSDDHGDTLGTATTVEHNRSISGNLDTVGDIDYFRFVLNSAGTITAFTTGDTDILGTLQNSVGNYIETNDDSGSGEKFIITRVLNSGTYYIAVSNLSFEETGPYSFRVDFTAATKLPDLAVDFVGVDRKSVLPGEKIRVDYHRSNMGDGDSGEFAHGLYLSKNKAIQTKDTQLIQFTSASMSAGASEESYYELIIPYNTIPGIHYLGYILDFNIQIVESNERNNRGYAEFMVEEPPDDHGNTRDTATTLELGRFTSGHLGTREDIDFFRIELNSAGTITVFTTGATNTDGGLIGSTPRGPTISNRDGGSEENFLITWVLNPGTYYIHVLPSFHRGTGPYSLFVDFTETTKLPGDDGDLVLGGFGDIAGEDIQHPNGNFFDQVLLTGPYIKLKAKPSQITRVSFMDEDEDIVQVEFSGAGTFTVILDPANFLPPALPPRYNQQVEYVTGKPSVVIEGADSSTFFSIFTVGKINAVNQALFPEGQVYDAEADVKLVEVVNSTGFGGMQLSNAVFSGSIGKVGIDARGIPIAVRLTVGDIDADGYAVPYLLLGENSFTVPADNTRLRITGGDLKQTNSASIVVAEGGSTTPVFETLITQNNFKSDGTPQPTQSIDATFVNEDGVAIPVTVNNLTIE